MFVLFSVTVILIITNVDWDGSSHCASQLGRHDQNRVSAASESQWRVQSPNSLSSCPGQKVRATGETTVISHTTARLEGRRCSVVAWNWLMRCGQACRILPASRQQTEPTTKGSMAGTGKQGQQVTTIHAFCLGIQIVRKRGGEGGAVV